MLVSAKATPTCFVFAFDGAPGTVGVDATRIAITTGAEVISAFPKSISSTSWRFPGDAYRHRLNERAHYESSLLTYLFV